MTETTLSSGVDRAELSAAVRPQDDLFRHVNGAWLERTEIPADRSVHGTFHELHEEAERQIRAIIEASAASEPAEGTDARRIGDLYRSFMDEERIESLGLTPLEPELALVDGVQDLTTLVEALGHLGRGGVSGPFGAYVDTDAKQSDRYILYISQGGLGLPDESYYRADEHAETRAAYRVHIEKMFVLAGRDDAATLADRVLEVETRLAAGHWDRVTNRDANKTYNLHTAEQFTALLPHFDLTVWATALGVDTAQFAEVVVRQPDYLTHLDTVLQQLDIASWQAWLRWRVLSGAASLLSSAFVDQSFSFYGTTLTGAPQLRERWKRGVSMVEGSLGEALGRVYVEQHFPPAAKERMVTLVGHLVDAYRQDISALSWMSPETKVKALDKLDKFTPKIGYPDRWRDYAGLELSGDDLLGNARRVAEFDLRFELAKLGGPVDRGEWFMTPQTVNAYYNPGLNEIVFPAAILQPPFFDLEADDAVNYGAIGAVIGHEIGHGFDDQGSKYDGDGQLQDWWTDADRAEFDLRTQALIAQYDVLEPEEAPGHTVNGSLTVGENIGDLGGLKIAYTAYQLALAGQEPPVIDGLTGAQRFFIGWAQAWRTKVRPQEAVRRLSIDPHSPAEFRCNAIVRNIDAFYEAFGTTPGDALWLDPAQRVRIW